MSPDRVLRVPRGAPTYATKKCFRREKKRRSRQRKAVLVLVRCELCGEQMACEVGKISRRISRRYHEQCRPQARKLRQEAYRARKDSTR